MSLVYCWKLYLQRTPALDEKYVTAIQINLPNSVNRRCFEILTSCNSSYNYFYQIANRIISSPVKVGMLWPVVLSLNPIIGIHGNPQRFVTIKTNPLLQKDDYYHLFFHYLCIVHMCSLVIFFVLTILLVHIPDSKIKVQD